MIHSLLVETNEFSVSYLVITYYKMEETQKKKESVRIELTSTTEE